MPNPTQVLNELKTAFETFKAANDERLRAVEKGQQPDALLVQKVEAANADITNLQTQLTDLQAKANRPNLEEPATLAAKEHRAAFRTWMAKGDSAEAALREAQIKAVATNVGTDAEGKFAVPQELSRTIQQLEQAQSPLLARVRTIQVQSDHYTELVDIGGTTSGWVAETAARGQTSAPSLAAVTPPAGELYAFPYSTQRALDDVMFDVEGWLTGRVAQKFGQDLAAAIITGNGTNQPKGITAYTIVTTGDSTRTFGQIQDKHTGSGTTLGSTPLDDLIDIIYSMKPGHRAAAAWAMNALTLAQYRKLTDGDGNYVWSPALVAGQPSTLLGFPALEVADMPDVGSAAYPVAFADWAAAYVITRRTGINVLRDPFTAKPYVGFYCTQRIGGGLVLDEAIKLLHCAT